MKRVGFITPNNDFYQMNYGEVEDFCKKICLSEENREAFLKFKEGYSYFSPYFDFVMINKKYLFFNPLYVGRKFMMFDEKAYYLNDLASFDYLENVNVYKEIKSRKSLISDFTTVSDIELGIARQDVDSTDECMIDPNLIGMMSRTGVLNDDGSHIVTGSTVLNQLLIKSQKMADDYYRYLREEGISDVNDAINYLVKNVGFLRVAGLPDYRIVIGNKKICSEDVREYLDKSEERGYMVIDNGGYRESMIEAYREEFGNKIK